MADGLYCDGGVIQINPSPVGGTYAYCLVKNGKRIWERAGMISQAESDCPAVTNNLTEMLAVLYGLHCLPEDWTGTVFSDSQITIGRLSMGWKWKNIPRWVHSVFKNVRGLMVNFEKISFVLLDGHPTKAQLELGVGRHGYPVSEHNVWCDQACGEVARTFIDKNEVLQICRRNGLEWCGNEGAELVDCDCAFCEGRGYDGSPGERCSVCHGSGTYRDACCEYHVEMGAFE